MGILYQRYIIYGINFFTVVYVVLCFYFNAHKRIVIHGSMYAHTLTKFEVRYMAVVWWTIGWSVCVEKFAKWKTSTVLDRLQWNLGTRDQSIVYNYYFYFARRHINCLWSFTTLGEYGSMMTYKQHYFHEHSCNMYWSSSVSIPYVWITHIMVHNTRPSLWAGNG